MTVKRYYIYALVDGSIKSEATTTEAHLTGFLPVGEDFIEAPVGTLAKESIIDLVGVAAVVPRAAQTLVFDKTSLTADGADTITVTGIAAGSTVEIRNDAFVSVDIPYTGEVFQEVSGVFQFSLTVSGNYKFIVTHALLLDSVQAITAVDP